MVAKNVLLKIAEKKLILCHILVNFAEVLKNNQ